MTDTAEAVEVPEKTITDILAALAEQRVDLTKRITALQPRLSSTALDVVAIVAAAQGATSIAIQTPKTDTNEPTLDGWVIDIKYGPAVVEQGTQEATYPLPPGWSYTYSGVGA